MPSRIAALLGDDLQQVYRRCEEAAEAIIGENYIVHPINGQGPQSITFAGTPLSPRPVVSFRIESGRLDPAIMKMARQVHGHLVPKVSDIGQAPLCGPVPLYMYKMHYQPGMDFWAAVGKKVRLNEDAVAKRTTLVKSLARYFARAYNHGREQSVTSAELEAERSEAVRRLAAMREFLPQISNVLDEIRDAVPRLFGPFYSRALTHADLSGGNVLLDERTWNITGILGWSGAAVRPFGVNLTSIFLSPHTDLESDADTSADADADADANADADDHVGRRSDSFRVKNVWQPYPQHKQLEDAFWAEFFHAIGIRGKKTVVKDMRKRIRSDAELMGRYEAIVRFGFGEKESGDVEEGDVTKDSGDDGQNDSGGANHIVEEEYDDFGGHSLEDDIDEGETKSEAPQESPPPQLTEVPIARNKALLKAWFGNIGYEIAEEEVKADGDLEDWEDLAETPRLGPKQQAGTKPGSFLSTRGRSSFRSSRPPLRNESSSRPRRRVKQWRKKDSTAKNTADAPKM